MIQVLLISLFFSLKCWSFVQVNPVRFYIKDTKFSHFTVRNTQSKPVKVEIESKYFSMEPDGKMVPDNSKAKDELKKILFTPKNFVLGPGEKQVVRFFIKDTLTSAELRTYAHLLTEVQTEEANKESATGTSMSLTPKVAVAIPIIYRSKNVKENIKISDETFSQTGSDCIMKAQWENKIHSSYVNVEMLDSDEKNIFQLNGVSNYLAKYDWSLVIPKMNCSKIKRIKIYDVDNEVYAVDKEIKH